MFEQWYETWVDIRYQQWEQMDLLEAANYQAQVTGRALVAMPCLPPIHQDLSDAA